MMMRTMIKRCAMLLGGLLVLASASAHAQPTPPPKPTAPPSAAQAVPGFWDPRRRPDRPDLSRITVIRFLTETDYPPFNFTGPDGNPAGFNVDLARLLCAEIKVTCTIQMRRFETLLDSLAANRGDAAIASMAPTPAIRQRVDFTDPYYRAPARFVSRKEAVLPEMRPEYLEAKKVGAIAGSSHEAYLKALFTDAVIVSLPNDEALRQALRRGEVDFIFGDSISLAFWINGTDFGRLLRLQRRTVHREPLFRRGHRHRRAPRQRRAAPGAELGDVPRLGKGPVHRPLAALFLRQSVLGSDAVMIATGMTTQIGADRSDRRSPRRAVCARAAILSAAAGHERTGSVAGARARCASSPTSPSRPTSWWC